MTETTEPTPLNDDFDLFEWIDSGTIARSTVELHNDMGLVAEFEDLDRRRKKALADDEADGDDEAEMGAPSEITQIDAALADLYERWEASKESWVVRALDTETIEAIATAHPFPPQPLAPLRPSTPPNGATAKERDRYKRDLETWRREQQEHEAGPHREYLSSRQKVEDTRVIHWIAAAVVEVQTPRGTATGVTVEQLERIRTRPHGTQRLSKLYREVERITTGDIGVPVPFSQGSSGAIQG